MDATGRGTTMRGARIALALVAATVFAAACTDEVNGADTTHEATASSSATEGTTLPEGFYIGTATLREAKTDDQAPPDVVDEFFPGGATSADFALLLDAGTWREGDAENGEQTSVGDLGTYEVDGDTIVFTSENVPQVLTFTWSFADGVLTLEPKSTTGNGEVDGWYPDELVVMAHDWELQA
jgi:hypothetical protein